VALACHVIIEGQGVAPRLPATSRGPTSRRASRTVKGACDQNSLALMAESRRFPPPWSVDDLDVRLGQECYIVSDANGHALAYVYFEDEPRRRFDGAFDDAG
jgi:hypothetical protein